MSKTALVTGVARGIGRAIAERFLREGYELFGTYWGNKEKADELVTQFGAERVKLFGSYDFRKTVDTQKLLAELNCFRFDSVVCSAGMFHENDDFNNFDLNIFNQTMHCNFYAPLILTTGLQNNINQGGSIVIMSSNDAYPGAFSSMSYSISKSALLSLMKCLAVNFGGKGIRVNSVAPGAIDTDMNTPEQMNISPYFTPIGRVGHPVDVSKVVYFLASDEAAFISGENITIDGGYNVGSILLQSEADPDLSKTMQIFANPDKRKTLVRFIEETYPNDFD
jgi:Dehydrogenases with different specificities (related to short-chain alcohol dehydrogenases)